MAALPPNRFVNYLYAKILANRSENDRAKLLSDLERPEPGREADDGVWSEQAQGDAFSTALAKQNMRGSMSSNADVKG